ncbi:hypothetical protein SKAU_G00383220 [Synaphobranchus kaupii]|uniref:Uncharacterized protein n=1 Tax=Synaphobranchus kaupii TaxID=118154 RepID=A0A9Q1EE11_SYNKA|nr:hypothetical protein SKAU_G00383220 [Synaphobranchus kaupii]
MKSRRGRVGRWGRPAAPGHAQRRDRTPLRFSLLLSRPPSAGGGGAPFGTWRNGPSKVSRKLLQLLRAPSVIQRPFQRVHTVERY